MTVRFPAVAAPFLRAILSGRTAAWPDLDGETTERMLVALESQGAGSLVHDAVRRGLVRDVPEPVASSMAREYMAVAARNAARLQGLAEVARVLSAVGIDVIVLKGAALADSVYESLALRPMGDCDVLVVGAELDAAARELERIGFRRKLAEAPELTHEWALVRRGPGAMKVVVELHRRLFASPPYDRVLPPAELAGRARTATVGGRDLPVLAPVDTVLHLAGHLVLQHAREERLIWVADIDRAVRAWSAAPGFWPDLGERAELAGLALAVGDALAAAALWFDTPVAAYRAVASPEERAAHARLRRRAPVGAEGARLLSDVRGLRGIRPRLEFALAHLFPPPAYMRRWYGLDRSWKLPVYYARRAVLGLGHIVSDSLRPATQSAGEPPERWMVES